MLFNSGTFLAFFVIVYSLYLLTQKWPKVQNILLLVASYIFYGSWDWRFLSLIFFSTLVDFSVGWYLGQTDDPKRRKRLLIISMMMNLGMLGLFKYFNFFAHSFIDLLHLFGLHADPLTLNVILPVGISFYTFQSMGYIIDVYRGQLKPTSNLLNFAVFVAFFPQLAAGPIERGQHMLPQIANPRRIRWEQINSAIFLIIWGYFKKMVIADNMGPIADQIFNNYTDHTGLDIALGVIAFSFQIYGDFSGYSDIARGIARLMGFDLIVNFRLPYLALNPSDFWNRWHVSLSNWLRDYLYIPLGGNRQGVGNTYRNLFLTMFLGGLWHGAAWNFVIWGAYHGLILIVYRRFEKHPLHADPWNGQHRYSLVVAKLLFMFILTQIGWLIFRASSASQIFYMLTHISLATSPQTVTLASQIAFYTLPLILIQLAQYVSNDLLILVKTRPLVRVLIYGFLLSAILIFGVRDSLEFIYFQF